MSYLNTAEHLLRKGMQQMQLDISEQQLQQLLEYLQLLDKWNQAYNLTAVRDPLDMVSRHLLDSLSILPYVAAGEITDVGSGAGLPGIPLAIMKPDLKVLSLDSNGKKTRFQFQVAAALKLQNFVVQQVRAESLQPATRTQQLVSRAFASLGDFIRLTEPLAAPNARWLAMKGLYPEDELAALPQGFVLKETHPLQVPGEDGQRHLLVLVRQENC
ncbi:16S rRNA (guanine(527)-N(7))-methyltransferase RsmG [Marinospirillum alkaliphilum]|uniref:Ribosomal RNA small subunit methyltransferase G n=1 Tax=Marinospirillum alkaliphilum DSM 21637 TaxID=1122209 RepID=A0A1K1WRL6_9GAMM|nr:16S rRNA (guanine(527)-N(7))-methyltransferase RsmG [Marinospirillum alkaliphilum]SFX39990.1 16S rRNA m(7)G-527 methyltransferase [Marinospirillum alkaliphilum DSM 21637]